MGKLWKFSSAPSNEFRFTLGLVLLTLLVINAGGWVFYAKAKNYMEQQSQKRLIALAKAVGAQIDRETVLAFLPGDEETEPYAVERDKLARLRDDADLDHVYLFMPWQGNLLDAQPGIPVGWEHPLADMTRPDLQPLWEGTAVGLPVHEIEDERFQSAFVPLLDEGELRAVVVVDANARFLSDLEVVRQGLLITAGLSLVLATGLGVYVSRNTRRLVTLQAEVKNREKLAALGTLTAGLAHEIRNPLSIIRASAELLQEEEKGDAHRSGTEIVEEVDRLSDLLTRFLDFARPKNTDRKKEDLSLLVMETISRVESGFLDRGIGLSHEIEFEPAIVSMDRRQIEQVLLNLILNAGDAVNGEGAVAIRLKRRRRPHPSSQMVGATSRYHRFAEITVEDNGCGIGVSCIQQMFNPFYTTKEKGTGLGLSIVHGIIQSHDGYLFVESEAGRGTRIGFGLPA